MNKKHLKITFGIQLICCVQGQNRAEYGNEVIKKLSKGLTDIYGKGGVIRIVDVVSLYVIAIRV